MSPLERETRFDDLARFVSEGIPRRQALRRIGGFMAALALSGPAEALGAKRKKKCPKGHVLCGTRCCPSGYSCHTHKGKKTCTCASPKKVCSGSCIDPRSDVHHCGSCSKKCKSGQTCAKGKCVTHKTTPTPTCSDGIKNANETDVDCGGPNCPKCATGKTCATGTDCQSGVCTGGVCVAPAPGCSADRCGAAVGCPPCANGKGCTGGADCTSGHCAGGVCVQCAATSDCTAAAAGSCQQAVCVGGSCGFAPDNTNVLAGTACISGTCVGGVPGSANKAAETACGAGMVCDGAGQCIGCVSASDCPPSAAGSCHRATCTAGVCGTTIDDTNVPASTACMAGICTAGAPGSTNKAAEIPCGTGLVCDGAGQCVGCVDPLTDCPQPALGSCHKAVCNSGVCGTAIDNTNLPADTACTTGSCTAGVPQQTNKADHTVCGSGLVCASGVCTGCATSDDCPAAAAGSCQKPTCTAGACGSTADNTNIPADTACTTGSCAAGVPQHTNKADETVCGTGMVCNAGVCTGCVVAGDCPVPPNECVVATCSPGGVCGTQNLAAGHAVSGGFQTPGDCQKVVCNGSGGFTSVDDPTDLPTSSSPCQTNPACVGSPLTPQFSNASTGTSCGGGMVCDGSGNCVGCNNPTDCPGTVTACQQHTCTGGTCGTASLPAGTACGPGGLKCDGSGNCVACTSPADCNLANATPACTAGVCQVQACNVDFANCDNDPATGCETNITNNPSHCGGCNKPCPALPNATTTCASSACVIASCSAGFVNCDGQVSNGCECNTTTSFCTAGVCSAKLSSGSACTADQQCTSGHCTTGHCT